MSGFEPDDFEVEELDQHFSRITHKPTGASVDYRHSGTAGQMNRMRALQKLGLEIGREQARRDIGAAE